VLPKYIDIKFKHCKFVKFPKNVIIYPETVIGKTFNLRIYRFLNIVTRLVKLCTQITYTLLCKSNGIILLP